ncbi:MAG: SLC26A/SulP transporter family protein, partial [Caldilineaceae bacterium]|nr:SLC26A/SulP transporter family protein [Caldilineaceae bacterium]
MRLSRIKPPAGFSLQQIVSALSAALVISVIVVFVEVSFGAMIFSGAFSAYMAVGIGLCLAGAFIHTVLATLASSSHNTIAVVQDAPVAIIAAIFVTISASLALPDEEVMLATGLAVIVLTSALAGIFFWILGRFNLGRLVRFIPYPVVGGFLAGTGYLLTVGGIGVMADAPLGQALFQPDLLLRWLPGFLYGIVLLLLLRRFSQFWVMPLLLVGGIAAFYALFLGAGGTLASATADGWLLGPFPSGRLWQPVAWLAVSQADWGLVFANVAKIATALLIGAVALLLNVSGLEVLSNEDVNLNRELRWSGVANLIGAVAAAPVGYTALSFSALGYRLAGPTRLVGLFTAAIVGATVVFGASMLSVFPRAVAGGLLVFVGLSFMVEWLVDSRRTLPRLDYALLWVILVVIAAFGFLEGVAAGILIAALLFLVNYSRVDVVRHAASRADYAGAIQRAPLYEQLLERRGRSMAILTLQGYIFFGTAHRLLEQITARLEDESLPPLRYLVMDFRLVTGMDSSSALSFARLKQATDAKDVFVVLTALSRIQWSCLAPRVFADGDAPNVDDAQHWRTMPSLNDGVTWCEQRMIDTFAAVGLTGAPTSVIDAMRARFPAPAAEVDWLDLLKPGTTLPTSQRFATFMAALARVEFAPGDVLLAQSAAVDGLFFLEEGEAAYQTVDDRGEVIDQGVLAAGTFFGVNGTYAGHVSPRTIYATTHGVLFCLTAAALARLEQTEPEL